MLKVAWLDINVESLSVLVTTEGNFQSAGETVLLIMAYDNIQQIIFEDESPVGERNSTLYSKSQPKNDRRRMSESKRGLPVLQVLFHMYHALMLASVQP